MNDQDIYLNISLGAINGIMIVLVVTLLIVNLV